MVCSRTVGLLFRDRYLSELFDEMLSIVGYRTVLAPPLAQRSPLPQPVDLLIADLALTADGQDEWAGIRRLRDLAAGRPIIICTSRLRLAGDQNLGDGEAILTMPFDWDELISLVDRLIGPAAS